jgi:hypothetical protein
LASCSGLLSCLTAAGENAAEPTSVLPHLVAVAGMRVLLPGSAEQEVFGCGRLPDAVQAPSPTGGGGFLVALHRRAMGGVGGPAGGRTPLAVGLMFQAVCCTTAPVRFPHAEEPRGTEHPFPALLFADRPRTEAGETCVLDLKRDAEGVILHTSWFQREHAESPGPEDSRPLALFFSQITSGLAMPTTHATAVRGSHELTSTVMPPTIRL